MLRSSQVYIKVNQLNTCTYPLFLRFLPHVGRCSVTEFPVLYSRPLVIYFVVFLFILNWSIAT